MNIQNKLFLDIKNIHENMKLSSAKIGCDGYWFDNWQDHCRYIIKYMLTESERKLLTDDERSLM